MGYICSNPFTTAFIWQNGDVTHCCYSNIGAIGNLNEQTLEEIFQGEKISFVRDQIAKGKYIEAGCEHFCRPFRWNQLYGNQKNPPNIPEGLGRLSNLSQWKEAKTPAILGVELGGKCNFKCKHCLIPEGKSKGVTQEHLDKMQPYLEKASIVRLVGGEFTVNRASLEQLKSISMLKNQPTVFMNTNGFIGLDEYMDCIENLKSFHFKFSLEGMGEDYAKIRIGGNWSNFVKNALRARDVCNEKNADGRDWRLYLNFCVMKSNFEAISKIVQFAVEHQLRLVLNTINGMRHIDENIFMYHHLSLSGNEIQQVVEQIDRILKSSDYLFTDELKQHLDYILRVQKSKKLHIPYKVAVWIQKVFKGQRADRVLYILYKCQMNPKSAWIYLKRKLKKRLSS